MREAYITLCSFILGAVLLHVGNAENLLALIALVVNAFALGLWLPRRA